jgi:hypothetical protein
MLALPALAHSEEFIPFTDKFAQQPFLLEKNNDGYFVYTLSSTDLRILRNTVFARHGYIFDSKDLETFFSARKWYKPVTKNVELSEMDKQNINFVLKFEKPDEATFAGYLDLFQKKELPIRITEKKYADSYSKIIPLYYVKKYFDMCCPEIRALDKVYVNDQFIIALHAVHYSLISISIVTYTTDGKKISAALGVGTYEADLEGYMTSSVTIDKDLNILIEKSNYETTYDSNTDKTSDALKNKTMEKYHITSNGIIQRLPIQ